MAIATDKDVARIVAAAEVDAAKTFMEQAPANVCCTCAASMKLLSCHDDFAALTAL